MIGQKVLILYRFFLCCCGRMSALSLTVVGHQVTLNSSMPNAGQLQDLLDNNSSIIFDIDNHSFDVVQQNEQSSGDRLVAFGPEFNGEKLARILSKVLPILGGKLQLAGHQPLPEMAPAAVLTGFEAIDELKPVIMELAEQLDIELTVVENPPSVDKPGVLLMDMDSTAIEIECIDEIAKLADVGEQVAAVTKRAMQGELDFAQSLHQRVATLKDADEGILKQVADKMPLMPGLEVLVAHLKSKGWIVAIASGGFTYFTERLKQMLGLTATFANELEIENGRLTGKVLGDVVDAQVKADVVAQLAREYNIEQGQTVAIGDGANDLRMLAQASLGVAFHAKPLVRQQAKSAVNKGGLEQLLYLLK